MGLPGTGDRATWPSQVTGSNDPDYSEWEEDCELCLGTGYDDWEGCECDACESTGKITCNNIGNKRS
jgi:hypothetical protein